MLNNVIKHRFTSLRWTPQAAPFITTLQRQRMKAFNIVKISALSFLLLFSSGLCATTLVKMKRIESSLSYSQAKKIGFHAEITDSIARGGLLEFRVAVPENIEGSKIKSILSEVRSSEQSVALIHMGNYSQEKKSLFSSITSSNLKYQDFYYININPKIIDNVILYVSCENSYNYIIEINLLNL